MLSSTHHNISFTEIWTVSQNYCHFFTLTSSYSKVVINPFIFKFSHKVQLQVYYNIVLQHTAAVCSAQAHWRQYSFMLLLLLSVKMRCVPWRESEMREEKLWKHQREMAFRGPKRGRKGTILRRWFRSEHCDFWCFTSYLTDVLCRPRGQDCFGQTKDLGRESSWGSQCHLQTWGR